VLVGRPEGERPRGIYSVIRGDNIKINLKEIASDCVDWINMIRDGCCEYGSEH